MRKAIVLITGLLILVLVNVSIYRKEVLLKHGRIVLLELAPVDPRSLMQGDYMALRFAVANQFPRGNAGTDGRLVLSLDERNVGKFERFDDGTPLAGDEVVFRYRIRNNEVKFATNAFFFEEGDAGAYVSARFGEFRVDKSGESLLVGLRDENLNALGSQTAN